MLEIYHIFLMQHQPIMYLTTVWSCFILAPHFTVPISCYCLCLSVLMSDAGTLSLSSPIFCSCPTPGAPSLMCSSVQCSRRSQTARQSQMLPHCFYYCFVSVVVIQSMTMNIKSETICLLVNVIEKLSGLRYTRSSNDASFHFERCHSWPSKICFQDTLGYLYIEVPTSPVHLRGGKADSICAYHRRTTPTIVRMLSKVLVLRQHTGSIARQTRVQVALPPSEHRMTVASGNEWPCHSNTALLSLRQQVAMASLLWVGSQREEKGESFFFEWEAFFCE